MKKDETTDQEKVLIGTCLIIALTLLLGGIGYSLLGVTGIVVGVCVSTILLTLMAVSGRDN